MEKNWYVVHTYSGYENKVKANLEKRVESMGMQDKIFRVIVPEEEETDIKNGKKKTVKRKELTSYTITVLSTVVFFTLFFAVIDLGISNLIRFILE